MKRRFTKMQGAGNDFVIIDARDHPFRPDPEAVRWIADRRFGVGCDQVLVVESLGGRLAYRVYNADGSEAGQCGNGARCVARRLHDVGALSEGDELMSPAGPIPVDFSAGYVGVGMGTPSFEPADAPFKGEGAEGDVTVDDRSWHFHVVSLGNPHAVVLVDEVDQTPVAAIGAALQADDRFPESVNVGFLQKEDSTRIRLRVFERGAGETLACGSGACAAVAVGRRLGLLGDAVSVMLPGGTLRVTVADDGTSLRLAGPAEYVFQGEFDHE